MLDPLLSALLPEQASRSARRACLAAILLFPAALAGGFFLLLRNAPPPPVRVTVDSASAIAVARDFLRAEGIPAVVWSATCKAHTDNSLLNFANGRPDRVGLWAVDPPVAAEVVFRSPEREETAVVTVSLDGRVVGFEWKDPPAGKAEARDEATLARARSKVPEGYGFGTPSVDRIGDRIEYNFRSSKIPDAELTETVTFQGGRLISFQTKAEPNERAGDTRSEIFQTLLSISGSLFLCVVVLFSIFRYASRTLQQEISHQRSLVVALLCAVFCVFLGFNAVVNSATGSVPFAVILLVFAVLGVIGGSVLAAAYASGEGDIREAFPGRLTSLDALLTGRLYSTNLGVSTLFGMACAGWCVLALGIFTAPFAVHTPQGSTSLASPLVRFGTALPLVTYPLIALSLAAAGLLQPLAFLTRYMQKKKRWHMPVLVICAALVTTLRNHSPSTGEFLATSAVLTSALLAPFFLLDLLATLVCVGTVSAAIGLALIVASIPQLSDLSLITHIGAGAGAIVFSLLAMAKGRTYTEEQVRPLYARHIAERKSLEAEVSAAREAQLRLLPESLPDFIGLDIAAACVPAETVGGDFYDFFPLGDGRLGVFIAEGNNRGLAAALTIALAKGYLMQCVERFREPVEILTRLEAMLAAIFPPDAASKRVASTDFAFAAIDSAAGEIRYARTGAYPKVVIVSASSVVVSERLVPVKGRVSPLSEGHARLAPGDHVVLFTDGLGRRLALGNKKPEDAAASLIETAVSAEQVRDRFFRETRASTEPDDLTLIVIRMQERAEFEGAATLRVVA